jgi:C2 domain
VSLPLYPHVYTPSQFLDLLPSQSPNVDITNCFKTQTVPPVHSPSDRSAMRLYVYVLEASGLAPCKVPTATVYVKLKVGKHKSRTRAVGPTDKPSWKEKFVFCLGDEESENAVLQVLFCNFSHLLNYPFFNIGITTCYFGIHSFVSIYFQQNLMWIWHIVKTSHQISV